MKILSLLVCSFLLGYSHSQQFGGNAGGQDFGEDNIYNSYALKQQAKEARALTGGFGYRNALFAGLSGFALSKLHSSRKLKSLIRTHQREQKQLYTQYYNDVYKMQETINECVYQTEHYKQLAVQVSENAELEAIQRDYDEFKQPDIDGDDRISRPEFNMYVKNYLSNYPGLAEKDYPRFEDFDHDRDGFVSFGEYAQQMAVQVQLAEAETAAGGDGGGKEKAIKGLAGMYGETMKVDNFNDLYAGYR